MFSIGQLELLCSFKGKAAELLYFGETPIGKRFDAYCEGDLENGEIKDTYVKMVTGNENYRWLTSAIIIGKGKSAGGKLEIDYFYES